MRQPAQHTADPCKQFAQFIRFDDIVVGAEFEPDDTVDRRAGRCGEDQPNRRFRAQPAAEGKTVFARHGYVEDGKVERFRGGHRPHCLRVRRGRYIETVGAEIFSHGVSEIWLVFNNNDACAQWNLASAFRRK